MGFTPRLAIWPDAAAGIRARSSRRVMRRSSAYQEIGDSPRQLTVRRTQQSQRSEAALQEDALLLREGQETVESMIRSHAAGTHSAERQIVLGNMQDRVVLRDSARSGSRQHRFYALRIVIEIIQR